MKMAALAATAETISTPSATLKKAVTSKQAKGGKLDLGSDSRDFVKSGVCCTKSMAAPCRNHQSTKGTQSHKPDPLLPRTHHLGQIGGSGCHSRGLSVWERQRWQPNTVVQVVSTETVRKHFAVDIKYVVKCLKGPRRHERVAKPPYALYTQHQLVASGYGTSATKMATPFMHRPTGRGKRTRSRWAKRTKYYFCGLLWMVAVQGLRLPKFCRKK